MKKLNFEKLISLSQKEPVVFKGHGKPLAVLVGVEGEDWETVVLETNAEFWNLIQKRRKQKTISLSEMRDRLKIKK